MPDPVSTGDENLELYGASCTIPEVRKMLKGMCKRNIRAFDRGTPREVLCIWGKPGIGKTDLGKQFAEDGYEVVDVPLAQFEEMGDLHGMPEIVEIEEKMKDGSIRKRNVTKQAIPSWAPTRAKKGLLLIDDFNRADGRIIKGIMQLIQDYRMITWGIPKGWTIVLTGNPDGGDYLVSSLDDAILTRMRHVTLEPDVDAWAQWAVDNNVDSRGVNFVLRHKEVITNGSNRTNPRTLTEFFRTLEDYPDLKAEQRMVEINAMASLDKETATTFLTFVNTDMDLLVEAADIFDRYNDVQKRLKKVIQDEDGTLKLDILGVITSRVMFHAAKRGFKPTKEQIRNFQTFLAEDFVPADKVNQVFRYVNEIQHENRSSHVYTLALQHEGLLEKVRDVIGSN